MLSFKGRARVLGLVSISVLKSTFVPKSNSRKSFFHLLGCLINVFACLPVHAVHLFLHQLNLKLNYVHLDHLLLFLATEHSQEDQLQSAHHLSQLVQLARSPLELLILKVPLLPDQITVLKF